MNMIKVIFKFENREPIYVSFNPTTKIQSLFQYVNDLFNLDHCHLFQNNIEINEKDSVTLEQITKANKIMLYVVKELNSETYLKTFPNQSNKCETVTQLNNSINSDHFDKVRAKKQAEKILPLLKKEHEDLTYKYNYKKELHNRQEKMCKDTLERSNKEVNDFKEQLKQALQRVVDIDKEFQGRVKQLNNFLINAYQGQYTNPLKIQIPLSPRSMKLIEYHNQQIRRKLYKDSWKIIMGYLDYNQVLNISTLNTTICKEAFEFLYQIQSSQKKINDSHIKIRQQKYQNYLKKTPFVFSLQCNTELNALKTQNDTQKKKLMEIFCIHNNDLLNKKGLVVLYRILFQLTNEIDYLTLENDDEFIKEIKGKIIQDSSFYDFINEKKALFNFSLKNIAKVGALIRKYEIYSIDSKIIAKECQTTGYIAMIIQEVFTYINIKKCDGLLGIANEIFYDDTNDITTKINNKYDYYHKRLIHITKQLST